MSNQVGLETLKSYGPIFDSQYDELKVHTDKFCQSLQDSGDFVAADFIAEIFKATTIFYNQSVRYRRRLIELMDQEEQDG